MANIDLSPHDAAQASRNALEPNAELTEQELTGQELGGEQGAETPAQRMQQLANDMARKSSDRTRRFEEGKGVVSQTDGH